MTHNRKWVFTELVKDANDPSQLIAYAIYKADKDDMANSMRSGHKTEPEIQAALDAFHDSVASTPRLLASYRQKSADVITTLVVNIAGETETKFIQQINKIKADNTAALAKEGKKAIDEYHKKIKQSVTEKQSRGAWWWDFTVSGFSGVWATLLLILIVWIISIASAPESERNHLTGNMFNRIWNYFNSSPLPDAGDVNSLSAPKAETNQLQKP